MDLYNAFRECLEVGNDYRHVENGGDYFVKHEGDTLKIFFEWSDGKEDWRNNFKFLAIPWKPYKNMRHTWFCHRGFARVWKAIEPYLVEDITNPKHTKFKIVGYSHGAALALLCYEYIKFNRPYTDVQGVGFGCPRVFWGFVSKRVKKRFEHFTVVRNGNDIVTHVPPALFGFRHISAIVTIGEGKSKGMVNDHRPENYIANLHSYE